LNILTPEKKTEVEDLLSQGHGIRAAATMAGVSKITAQKISREMDYKFYCPTLRLSSIKNPCQLNLARAREIREKHKFLNCTFERCLECGGGRLQKKKSTRVPRSPALPEPQDAPQEGKLTAIEEPMRKTTSPDARHEAMREKSMQSPAPAPEASEAAETQSGEGEGGAATKGRKMVIPGKVPEDQARALIDKFPEFDSTWPLELQMKWFEGFKDLMQANK
jgi:hypothetical protein